MTFLETAVALIILRCDNYLTQAGIEESLSRFPFLNDLLSRLDDESLEAWARAEYILRASENDTKENGAQKVETTGTGAGENKEAAPFDIQAGRYYALLRLLGGSPVMQSFLDLQMTLFSFPEFGAYLTAHFGYSVNLHLACLLEGKEFPTATELKSYAHFMERICFVDRKASPLQYAEPVIDDRVMSFLLGSDEISSLLSPFTALFEPVRDGAALNEAFVHEKLIEAGASFLGGLKESASHEEPAEAGASFLGGLKESASYEESAEAGASFLGGLKTAAPHEACAKALQLSGKGGRRFISKHIAKRISKPFLFLNIADFFREAGKEHIDELRSALLREAAFSRAGICFYGITEGFLSANGPEGAKLKRDLLVLEQILFAPLLDASIPLILCTDTKRALLSGAGFTEYLLLELPDLTDYNDRKKLWAGFASIYGLHLDEDRFAMRYRLSASEISSMIQSFKDRRPEISEIGQEEEALFARLCIERAEAEEARNLGRVIYSDLRLSDVKVKPQIRSVLNDAVEGIRKSGVVLDAWGLRKNYPYGRSVSLLLTGPPGTGKTMTANAIAGELSLPLYQVNLSNIVDKYIGETEKNLEKAFLFAEKTDSVLFFDEADSLFGVRSEVHDAKDRYANTEISYLLQRIEAFDGIVIMATNLKSNIDPAFLRRIRYVVRYENPDEALRREIWEGCLIEGLPHKDIDLDYLASQFDTFTGSMIKTVFLNACAYAAGKDEILAMPHLIHALKLELEKTSTVAFSSDTLGKYAYLQM